MTEVLRLLRRRRATRGEGGFALVAVMTAIAVFGVIVIALLGLSLQSVKITDLSRRAGASRRPIEGALTAAINQIKISPDGSLGRMNSTTPCRPVGSASQPVPYSVTIDGTAVEVDCQPRIGPAANLPLPTNAGAAITLLGQYRWIADDLEKYLEVNPSVRDFLASLGLRVSQFIGYLDQYRAGLLHFGPEALLVDGDLTTTNYVFGLRDGNGVPALDVDGNISQASAIPPFVPASVFGITPPSNCGLMDPWFQNLGGGAVQLKARKALKCGMGLSSGYFADPYAAASSPGSWTTTALSAGTPLPAVCPRSAVGVVTFEPGAYNAIQTGIMNSWFGGACRNTTFWFKPGAYYFDVAGRDAYNLLVRSALTLDDRSSNFVFGTPLGWDPAAGRPTSDQFPGACDVTAPGVAIVLSARSTIRHLAGWGVACGNRDASGNPQLLVHQLEAGGAVAWYGEPDSATTTLDLAQSITTPADATASAAAGSPGGLYPAGVYGDRYDGAEPGARYSVATCTASAPYCRPTWTFTGFGNADQPAYGGDIKDQKLLVHFKTSTSVSRSADPASCPGVNPWNCSYFVVRITPSDSTPERPRQCTLSGGYDNLSIYEGSLRAIAPSDRTVSLSLASCANQGITDATQLDGATVNVTASLSRVNGTWSTLSGCFCDTQPMTLSLDYVWLQATTVDAGAPSAFYQIVDTSSDVGSLTFLGPVHVPRTQVEINWWNGALRSTPLFGGGLVARALASWRDVDAGIRVGKVASPSVRPGSRRVLIRAKVGDRLRGSAVVAVNDGNANLGTNPPGSPTQLKVGNQIKIEDWQLCDDPWPTGANAGDVGCS